MTKIIIAGGGFAGCAAAVSAQKAGAEVTIVERMDELLGTGLAGGVMRNNGRFTATEEAIAMGGGGLIFQLIDAVSPHKNFSGFPGHNHPSAYYRMDAEPLIRKTLLEMGIEIYLETRVMDVEKQGGSISRVILSDGTKLDGDVFLDTTGTSGPMGLCKKYGNGCVSCILRCPTFNGRVSLTAKAGVKEKMGYRSDGTPGAMTGAFDIHKDSLAPELAKELTEKGIIVVPLPKEEAEEHQAWLGLKTCQQYALTEFAENLVIVDNGYAKVHTSYVPLHELRKIPGFERAHINAPLAGGQGNSIRYLAMAPRDNTLKVEGIDNLFCGGEKAGLFVGHTEAIVTGSLAGHNAVRCALGKDLLELSPEETVLGDILNFVNERMSTEEGMKTRYTFSGSTYFERMKELGTYTTDTELIQNNLKKNGLAGLLDKAIAC